MSREKQLTRVYGTSDDLVEIEGGKASGEIGCYGTDDRDQGVLLIFDDGTLLEVKYCKRHRGVWGIDCLRSGEAFDHIEACDDDDADPYSDQAFFKLPMKWCCAATEWQLAR